MASVYHLISSTSSFPHEIIKENGRLEQPNKKRYFAALCIQRCYRGFKARYMIKEWNEKATLIQKVVRGWLVRWHRIDHLRDYLERLEERDLNQCATKIQAYWRGYRVRKHMKVSIKETIRRRKSLASRSLAMRDIMRNKFGCGGISGAADSSDLNISENEKNNFAEECKRWVLFILFKTRHMIRTKCREGIYSTHNSDQLSQIENWMKSLPMKEYMSDLRKVYNEHYKDEKKMQYMFTDEKLRKYERLYRTRTKDQAVRETIELDKSIHEKPFDLYKKPKVKPYERNAHSEGKYVEKMGNILLRTFSPCSTEFDLYIQQMVELKPSKPPYYIDFWNAKCNLHHVDD